MAPQCPASSANTTPRSHTSTHALQPAIAPLVPPPPGAAALEGATGAPGVSAAVVELAPACKKLSASGLGTLAAGSVMAPVAEMVLFSLPSLILILPLLAATCAAPAGAPAAGGAKQHEHAGPGACVTCLTTSTTCTQAI